MNIRAVIIIVISLFIIAVSSQFISAIDAPHSASNNISCGNCHGQTLLNSPFWSNSEDYDIICQSCHTEISGPYSEIKAPFTETHSSDTTSENYGTWSRQCRNCHNPHYQRQKIYKNTDASKLYLATGKITSCLDNGDNTSTLTYGSITYKQGWDSEKIIDKTEKGGRDKRTAILFPNMNKLGYNYVIDAIDPDASMIKVRGDACATLNLTPPPTFAAIYGQYIKDTIEVGGENKPVKFFDNQGVDSFADGDTTYNGICEVCHTRTDHFRNDGGAIEQNHENICEAPGTNCIPCHKHRNGLGHGGGGSETDCVDCHGHDDGWNGGSYYGTTQSHSTHTENDSDDVKGPLLACNDCHDTDHYTCFKTGVDSNGDGRINLSETDVCDNCHSPGGSYNGVNSVNGSVGAKDNWKTGVYTGNALTSGKEKWCAGCHDDQPAYSMAETVTPIIMDDSDATYVCGWNWRNQEWGYYESGYRWHALGSGSCTATWRPTILKSGYYKVYAWWQAQTNRASNAPYTINYDGGSETIHVNQQHDSDQWNYLGIWPFVAGTTGSIVLSDNADNNVIADAIKFDGPGTYAPNVVGDNTTYGFYVTGHKISCTNCHDASKKHIDHEHRTYEADENTFQAINPYCESYRLKDINGKPCMIIPRPLHPLASNPILYPEDFALCFDCHNKNDVLNTTGVPGATNFWNNDESPANSHNIHLGIYSYHFDSDWDSGHGTHGSERNDSSESCTACHNVHGSPKNAMIRHGELISSYSSTDKVPSLNFVYVKGGVDEATATWLFAGTGGNYNVYARWTSYSSRASNAKYIVTYNNGANSEAILKDQRSNGGQWVQLGTGTYLFGTGDSVVLSIEGADGEVIADAIGWDADGVFVDDWDSDSTLDPEIVVDNLNASYTPSEWSHSSWASGYHNTDYQFHYKPGATPVPDPNLSLEQSIGGMFNYGGAQTNMNGVCRACHSAISYIRTPNLSPRIINAKAYPDTIQNNTTGSSLITAFILDHDNNVSTVTVNLVPIGGSASQTMYDDGTHGDLNAGDGTYSYMATIPSGTSDNSKNLVITATDTDANTGQNTATLYVVESGAVYIDNKNGSATGSWPASTFISGFYGENYQYHLGGSGTDTFTWTLNITTHGAYEVFARWTQDPSRAPDATYTVYHDGGSTPVAVDQRSNGGTWVSLGTYDFDGINDYIELVQSPDGYVIADAIKVR